MEERRRKEAKLSTFQFVVNVFGSVAICVHSKRKQREREEEKEEEEEENGEEYSIKSNEKTSYNFT